MSTIADIRRALASMPSDHDAAGEHRPTVDEIFTPEQHANALDPNTPVVVGSRGTGKSFWAGVLEQDDTRHFAASVYPNLGLESLIVRAGYTGFAEQGGVTARIIDQRVPIGKEQELGYAFWLAVIIRAARALGGNDETIAAVMKRFGDPEDAEAEMRRLDKKLSQHGQRLLITFDALDTWSNDWVRSSALTDALFEVVWSLRARRSIKAKVFIRPEQLSDESLKFVEMPKLRSGRVQLEWSLQDLYALLYWRLSETTEDSAKRAFSALADEEGAPIPPDPIKRRRSWQLLVDKRAQERMMIRLSGQYMGKGHKKGKTYEWPYKHLADARGEVTPRSFIKLFVEAAKATDPLSPTVLNPEGIRHGLREASKVRVDQLVVEYKWVKRALAPLAGLVVPCDFEKIHSRWSDSRTIDVIRKASLDPATAFLPPFPFGRRREDETLKLAQAMERIGVFATRSDDRIDMPDLFRVAARMLKKGGVAPM